MSLAASVNPGRSLVLALIGFLALVLAFVELPWQGMLAQALQDAGHVLVSGMIAVCCLIAVRQSPRTRSSRAPLQYFMAFVAAISIGAVVEVVQYVTGRDSEVQDVLRNIVGAVTFLGFIGLADTRLRVHWRRNHFLRRGRLAAVILILLAVSWVDVFAWGYAYLSRDARFPLLVQFRSPWSTKFVHLEGAELDFTDPPTQWSEVKSMPVGKIQIANHSQMSMSIREPYPDWRAYQLLVIRMFNDGPAGLPLTIRIHDKHHNKEYDDRFNKEITVAPGQHTIVLPLREVIDGPASRLMDMQHIAGIELFTRHWPESNALLIDSLELSNAKVFEIASFHSSWHLPEVTTEAAQLEFVPPPKNWVDVQGHRVGKLIFSAAQHPGIMIESLPRDWRDYHALAINIFSKEQQPLPLGIRIHDQRHNESYDDRYNLEMIVTPGQNIINIPLRLIQDAPSGRQMDMTQIDGIGIFARQPARTRIIYIDSMRLDRQDVTNQKTTAEVVRERRNGTPLTLFQFQTPQDVSSVHIEGAKFELAPAPERWSQASAAYVGKLSLREARYPGITMEGLFPDWRDYHSLVFTLFSEGSSPFPLSIRVHDAEHNQEFDDRFNRVVQVVPGANTIKIPLSEIRDAPKGRMMNLNQVAGMQIFVYKAAKPYTIYIDTIRLE